MEPAEGPAPQAGDSCAIEQGSSGVPVDGLAALQLADNLDCSAEMHTEQAGSIQQAEDASTSSPAASLQSSPSKDDRHACLPPLKILQSYKQQACL